MNPAPANGASGPPQTSTQEQPVKRRIKKTTTDPFSVTKPRGQPLASRPNGHFTPQLNGRPPSRPQTLRSTTPNSQRSTSPGLAAVPSKHHVSGFSDPEVIAGKKTYTDYKLVTTKKDLLDGLRYHILHLSNDKGIDVRDSSQFSQPAHLHRRDPRSAPPGQHKDDSFEPRDGMTAGEREEMNRRKEIRQQERAANLAQIAPSQASRKLASFKTKTKQVYKMDFTEADKRRIQTNYEEKLPWHLEDFDNKHCFVGENQIGSTNTHAAFVYEPAIDSKTGKFRLIPIEKLYQFQPKRDLVKEMTVEEAEAAMNRKGNLPEWLVQMEEKQLQQRLVDREEKSARKIFSGETKTNKFAGRTGEEADYDFDDAELFADDEEGDLFAVKDEDEKQAEKKIKEDQLLANFFEVKEEREYDEAEEEERKEAEARKINFRGLRKALEKREHNYNHGSDSEYSSSTDSEEERERLEQEKNNTLKVEDPDGKKSAAPSSGAVTPSGRREKSHGGASDREGSARKKLKRPGSPNLSDASGTDTSVRKKPKTKHLSSMQPTPSTTRPGSPANVPGSSAPGRIKSRTASTLGAGSDTDTAMSDGGTTKSKKIKLRITSAGVTSPRATSPDSRAGSPAPAAASIPRPDSTGPTTMPTAEDIRDILRKAGPAGLTLPQLLSSVAHPRDQKQAFVKLVQSVASWNKEKKVMVLKE